MPILGADMSAGTLRSWYKRPGDRVARGDIVAEVETEKGIIDVEIFIAGVIEKVLVEPGARAARTRLADLQRRFLFGPATIGRHQKTAVAAAARTAATRPGAAEKWPRRLGM